MLPSGENGALATIVSIHSFRGGTGKSNTTANVAAMLAAQGRRVGVIDADIQSPGIHNLFGLVGDEVTASLNDFLWHGRPIAEVAHEVSGDLGTDGPIYLIPSSMQPGEITPWLPFLWMRDLPLQSGRAALSCRSSRWRSWAIPEAR